VKNYLVLNKISNRDVFRKILNLKDPMSYLKKETQPIMRVNYKDGEIQIQSKVLEKKEKKEKHKIIDTIISELKVLKDN